MKREPILIIAGVNILLQAAVVMAAVLLTVWTKEETAAVSGVIAVTFNLAAAFFGRSLTTPTVDPRDNDVNPLQTSCCEPGSI